MQIMQDVRQLKDLIPESLVPFLNNAPIMWFSKNVSIGNGDVAINSHAYTSNSFSPILPVKITSFWSRNWLDWLYLIQIFENKFGRGSWASHNSGAAFLLHLKLMAWYYSFTLMFGVF